MKLRALIVDDEPLARERLRALLRSEPAVEIVGESGDGTEAVGLLRNTPLDVVFLDIEMPGCSGLQVAEALPSENRPAIIFVTAHADCAVEAFAIQATDYLLKPFDRERLQTAVRRAQDYLRLRQTGTASPQENANGSSASGKKPERLTVKADGRVVFLKPEEIVWVEAADNYVIIHLADSRLMVRETLIALEERLGAASFARVNRSALVHLDQIRELKPAAHGDYLVVLRNGTQVPLSRNLRGRLGKFTGEA